MKTFAVLEVRKRHHWKEVTRQGRVRTLVGVITASTQSDANQALKKNWHPDLIEYELREVRANTSLFLWKGWVYQPANK